MAKQSKSVTACQDVLTQLKQGKYSPVYMLHGDEPYFCDRIANYMLDNALAPEARAFNQFALYGREVAPGQLVDSAMRSPINSERLLIVVREAQDMRNIEPLADYAEHPIPSTVLVLCYSGKIKPGRGKSSAMQRLLAAVRKQGLVFESIPLRDYEVSPWILLYAKGKGLTMAPQAAEFLVYQMGTDISAIANQLEKLAIMLPEGTNEITQQMLAEHIGVSREFNPYELTRAMGNGNFYEANRIAINMAGNPKSNNISYLLVTIHGYFTKVFLYGLLGASTPPDVLASRLGVHPYFLKEYAVAAKRYPPSRCLKIFSTLRALDLRTKGYYAEALPLEEALKETISRIMR